MSATPFGLYRAASMAAAQRISAGARFELDTPSTATGATTFRTALWLPVPDAAQPAQALRAVGALAWRFEPLRLVVHTDDRAWISQVQAVDDDTVRLTMTWPAPLVRIGRQTGSKAHARWLELRRVDGEAVADDAAASGSNGRDLAQAWIGSPFEVRLGTLDFSIAIDQANDSGIGFAVKQRAAAPVGGAGASAVAPGTGATVGTGGVGAVVATAHLFASAVVPTVTIAGRPTSPRLSLVAEQPHGETLLWQELRPGEQASAVTLPTAPLAEAWGPALAQLQRLSADPATRPLRLRLDLVSDAPCAVVAAALTPSIEAERELLAEPQRLDFSGTQAETWPLVLDPALGLAGVAPADVRSLTLRARWVGGDGGAAVDGGATPTPADPRRGAWAEAGRTLLQPLDLRAPRRCEGVAWFGQALGAPLTLNLRLLADGGGAPATRVLAEQTLSIATASAPGWLAARWPAVDLQPQRVWLALGVSEGAALWAFGAGDASVVSPAAGLIDADGARQPLPEPLAAQLLAPPAAAVAAGGAVQARLGGTLLSWRDALADAPAQDDAALRLTLDATQAAVLLAQPLRFSAGTAGSLHIESVRLTLRA